MRLEARSTVGPHWTVLCSRRTGHSLFCLGESTPAGEYRVGMDTRGSPLFLTHLCLALKPHRCLAAAAGNKDRLSRKGEGKGSRPQTPCHLSSCPSPLPQWLPREGAGPSGTRTGLDPSEPS